MNGNIRTSDGAVGVDAPSGDERPWKVAETAAYLGVAVQTLYRWNGEGVGPAFFKMRGRTRYWPADVRAWAAEQASKPRAKTRLA